jgi:pectin methylesterase-like acyl-CoA thioesterase
MIGEDNYSTIQDAYDSASDENIIMIQSGTFNEDVYFDDISNKSVTIQGGYECNYGTYNGTSTLSGTMTTISNGSVSMGNIILGP